MFSLTEQCVVVTSGAGAELHLILNVTLKFVMLWRGVSDKSLYNVELYDTGNYDVEVFDADAHDCVMLR